MVGAEMRRESKRRGWICAGWRMVGAEMRRESRRRGWICVG